MIRLLGSEWMHVVRTTGAHYTSTWFYAQPILVSLGGNAIGGSGSQRGGGVAIWVALRFFHVALGTPALEW